MIETGENKREKVYNEIQESLQNIEAKRIQALLIMEKNKFAKIEVRPNTLISKINSVIYSCDLLTLSEFDEHVNYDYLKDMFNAFSKLVADINIIVDFVPDKQQFSAFCGFTTAQYNQLLNHTDDDMQLIMNQLEDYLISSTLSAAMTGTVKEKTAGMKVKLKNSGHNQQENKDITNINVLNINDEKQQALQQADDVFKSLTFLNSKKGRKK